MRIGIFSECYHPTLNGVVISIETFRQELEKRGHEYFIFAPGCKGYCDKKPEMIFRYPSLRIPWVQNYPIGFPRLAPRQTDRIKDLKLDIIHTQHLFGMGKLGLRVGRSLNIPVVHTYHTLITEYTHYAGFLNKIFPNLVKNVLIGMSRRYCNACDQIVTPSPSMKKLLLSYGVVSPIEPIATGIDLAKLQNPYPTDVLKTKWHIPESHRLLLYVGRIAKEKNIGFLLDAIKMMLLQRKDIHLLLAGGGPELSFWKSQVEKWEIQNNVTFAGEVAKEEVNRYFGAAEIFTYPSITETQGIVVTEAMAAGTPCVAVARMGPTDLITDNQDGFLVDLKLKDFVAKINLLLENNNLRQEFSKNAKKNAQRFSMLNSALHLENLYESVIRCYHTR